MSESQPSKRAARTKAAKVLSYRVAVKRMAICLLQLAATGELNKFDREFLEEFVKNGT